MIQDSINVTAEIKAIIYVHTINVHLHIIITDTFVSSLNASSLRINQNPKLKIPMMATAFKVLKKNTTSKLRIIATIKEIPARRKYKFCLYHTLK